MSFKKNYLIIIILAMAGMAHAKNMHKIFGTGDKIIKGTSKIELFMIDPQPIISIDQIHGEDYIYDYHIIKTITIKKKAGMAIIHALLDTTQYVYEVSKKCPFMGKYVVQFKKGAHTITIILSTEPCDKAIIFCPGSLIDKKHIDLVEKGSMISSLSTFFTIQQNK